MAEDGGMHEIAINELELNNIDLIRIALSEKTDEARQRAIWCVKHEVLAKSIEAINEQAGAGWTERPENKSLMDWVVATTGDRQTAAMEFTETVLRYAKQQERKLNIAEEIGFHIFLSIQEGRNSGVQTRDGILERVRHSAKEANIAGAKDRDTLRTAWNDYRGVFHLGLAMNFCEENPEKCLNVLHVAEELRELLSTSCPRGTQKPYVDAELQTSFVYKSTLKGPRFHDRGLHFSVE